VFVCLHNSAMPGGTYLNQPMLGVRALSKGGGMP
jgi:hypothetical protein